MNQFRPTISTIILARNEAARIAAALESVAWTNERIVIDNASSDATARIAQRLGARVVSVIQKNNFAALRNRGLKEAKGDWILYIDADEVVTTSLKNEIIDRVSRFDSDKNVVAYFIVRENRYFGRGWPYRDKMERLFWKSRLSHWKGALHETPIVSGAVGRLTQPLHHDTHRTLEEMLDKTNEWSQTEAKLRLDAHHPPVVWWRLLRVMFTGFYESYIKQGGWRAGTAGLIESIYQGYSMFITYAKLWEMQQP